MAEKTLRIHFQVNSNDGTSPVSITVNGTSASLAHTKDWSLTDNDTGSVYTDVVVTTEEVTQSELSSPLADPENPLVIKTNSNIEMSITGGSVLLVGLQENYVLDEDGLTNENFSDLNSTCMINSQPTINDEPDLLRYDISGHIPEGGELGQGNLPIYENETVKFSVLHTKRIIA